MNHATATRTYTIYANYLPTPLEIKTNDIMCGDLLSQPQRNCLESSYGSLTTYTNVKSLITGEEVTNDNGMFYGLPLGMTKEDVITRYKLNSMNEIRDAIKSDTFVRVKEVITIDTINPSNLSNLFDKINISNIG